MLQAYGRTLLEEVFTGSKKENKIKKTFVSRFFTK